MRLFRPCFITGWLFPEALLRIKTPEKVLCLTFDDGPDPDSTPQLLDILDKHDIKALFFCDGRAAEKYPDLIKQIISKGHIIGNHGYSHLDGWRTDIKKYTDDISRASNFTSDKIFRPPYGRLSLKQDKTLLKSYKLVLWDIMPYDFDRSFGSKNSLRVLSQKIRRGSLIALHDTPNSTVKEFLSEFIGFSTCKGYRFILPELT